MVGHGRGRQHAFGVVEVLEERDARASGVELDEEVLRRVRQVDEVLEHRVRVLQTLGEHGNAHQGGREVGDAASTLLQDERARGAAPNRREVVHLPREVRLLRLERLRRRSRQLGRRRVPLPRVPLGVRERVRARPEHHGVRVQRPPVLILILRTHLPLLARVLARRVVVVVEPAAAPLLEQKVKVDVHGQVLVLVLDRQLRASLASLLHDARHDPRHVALIASHLLPGHADDVLLAHGVLAQRAAHPRGQRDIAAERRLRLGELAFELLQSLRVRSPRRGGYGSQAVSVHARGSARDGTHATEQVGRGGRSRAIVEMRRHLSLLREALFRLQLTPRRRRARRREHAARHHEIVDEPGRVRLHLYEASHDVGAVNVRGAGLVGTGHLRALLHDGRESDGVRPPPRVAFAPPLVRVFRRGAEAGAEGRVAAERGDALVHVRSLLPLPRREELREFLEEAAAPNGVAQRDSRVQPVTHRVRVSRRGRSRGVDGRGLVLVRDHRHARFRGDETLERFSVGGESLRPCFGSAPRGAPGDDVPAAEVETDVKLVPRAAQTRHHLRERVSNQRRLHHLREDVLQRLVQARVHDVLQQHGRVVKLGRHVPVPPHPPPTSLEVHARPRRHHLVHALPHAIELLRRGRGRARVHQRNPREFRQPPLLLLLLLFRGEHRRERRRLWFPFVVRIAAASPAPAAEPRLSSAGLLPLRLRLGRRLRFPPPSFLFLLDRRGDGGVHERVRVLAVILARDDEVQSKRAGLHQRHARSHQQNLLRARQRHHRAQQFRLLERALHLQRHAAFRLRIGQRPSPSPARAYGGDEHLAHHQSERLEAEIAPRRVLHEIVHAEVEMLEVFRERLGVLRRLAKGVRPAEEPLERTRLLAHVEEPNRRRVRHANQIRKRALALFVVRSRRRRIVAVVPPQIAAQQQHQRRHAKRAGHVVAPHRLDADVHHPLGVILQHHRRSGRHRGAVHVVVRRRRLLLQEQTREHGLERKRRVVRRGGRDALPRLGSVMKRVVRSNGKVRHERASAAIRHHRRRRAVRTVEQRGRHRATDRALHRHLVMG